jgi:hypothetical protein
MEPEGRTTAEADARFREWMRGNLHELPPVSRIAVGTNHVDHLRDPVTA